MRPVLLVPIFLLAGCQPQEQTASLAADSARVARAQAAASDLGADLMAMLTSELARGGPAAAIAVCADSAQVRTSRHEREGVTVRRVGTRVRNLRNTPDSLESAVLAAFQAELRAGGEPTDTVVMQPVEGGQTRVRYLRAIRVQPQCLTCHGPESGIPDTVRAILATRYPDDGATGYAAGDLRGAISVQVDPD